MAAVTPLSPPLRIVGSGGKSHPEDVDLAEALAAGEEWASRATWVKHGPTVFRFLQRALGPDGEAEDLTQEVFLRVFAKIGSLRDPRALGSFVFSVAVRTLKWELRRRRVRRIFHLSTTDDGPEPSVPPLDAESREALRRFYAILDRLSAQQRAAFVLRHVEGMKLEEIAVALGLSLATVKRRLHRASKLVDQCVEKDTTLVGYVALRGEPR